jgi:hypothetical protein
MPIFKPACQYLDMQVFYTCQYLNMPVFRHAKLRHTSIHICEYLVVPIFRCASIQMLKHIDAPIFRYVSILDVPVYRDAFI